MWVERAPPLAKGVQTDLDQHFGFLRPANPESPFELGRQPTSLHHTEVPSTALATLATEGGRMICVVAKKQSCRYQEWPRTAAILSGLARSYEHEASLHDREAETICRGLPV